MTDVRVPAGTLKWLGDSLLCDGEPAIFQLVRCDGRIDTMPLRECLSVADRIDSYGLSRIVSALDYGLQHNMLANDDRDAWVTGRTRVLSLSTAERGE
ncbi:hypothetical protein KDW98_17890 [Burkholderia vietnamiensis]|uniref:hypothetical protein n=1 Tax=Burkholderia vietnamiensis TaxID=60552 RepID=UPI001BA11720|nr:hypothetical protein [Burkholderia vietnamiensis]MBR8163036.1 hypothetical protein [Burkholderia vietnamiensis]